ncbi:MULTISPECIES: hypothetical protein [unclassified Oleiphilus]|uniref:hypothetical protein n=1 Tax=unclassified Oleiphilus TaxID=2631174 RepID=UPI0007C26A12|nr:MULTISPECIES: hypothetical protein [unclassified Oleiphilus]KZY44591.1 hypothetical protein A3732_01515 [Oleiphilus sp. HI0050]KZZ36346.1 hypothetical protein A3756_13300 [Oleiphilus sp. HI0086]KZZ39373.1 hypothetical protein A3757_06510 [Oleiphilus sp. HI0117]KZZ56010.1 hypothetical protein A3761_01080 [Oleiphilus sp. HI0123]
MLVNEEFKNEIKRTFKASFEESITAGSDPSRWYIKERTNLDNLNEAEFYVLTMSSQLFRIFVLFHFTKKPETESLISETLKINQSNLDDDKFYDYLGEVGNAFLGAIKRDIGKAVPSLGMSTPNRLSKDCLKYMKSLNTNFESHSVAEYDDQALFYASVYLVADEELDIRIDRHLIEQETDSGELEMF